MTAKLLLSCIIGSMLEWYDFALFGVLSPFLSKLFFPHKSPSEALLYTFGFFAVAYLVRPIGALLFGHIGDKYGRKKAVVISIFLMTIGTTGIGLLPTGATDSLLLLALFLAFRIIQGLSVGGECPSALVLIIETSTKKLFFNISVLYIGIIMGMLLGSIIGSFALALSKENIFPFAPWRLPFLASIFLGGIGLYLRTKGVESSAYSRCKSLRLLANNPIKDVIIKNHVKLLTIAIILAAMAGMFYYIFIYNTTRISLSLGQVNTSTASLILALLFIPIALLFSSPNRAKYFLGTGLLFFTLIPIFIALFNNVNSRYILLPEQCLLIFFIAPAMPLLNGFIALFMPVNVRLSGIAIVSALSSIIGGVTPFICEYLSRWNYGSSVYISLLSLLGLLAFLASNKLALFSNDRSLLK